jgi:hypothetical protein
MTTCYRNTVFILLYTFLFILPSHNMFRPSGPSLSDCLQIGLHREEQATPRDQEALHIQREQKQWT